MPPSEQYHAGKMLFVTFCCTVKADPPYAQDNQTKFCPQDVETTHVNYGAQWKKKKTLYLIMHVLFI